MRKITAIVLAFLLILSSCKNSEDPAGNSSEIASGDNRTSSLQSLSIPYIENDSFNPYTVYSSVNSAVIPLLYDSLVVVNNSFEAEYSVAEKIERTSATALTVTIKDNIFFSDSNKMNAADVVFSFQNCKTKGSYYPEKLSGISGATASGDRTVVFTLSAPDRYIENCLDFPITEKIAGIDNPVGSGRYTLSSNGDAPVLKANQNHFKVSDYTFDTVTCVAIPDNDSLFYAIKTGMVNIIPADLSLGTYMGSFCLTKNVSTGNFVYLGVSENGIMAEPPVRKYISACLDRSVIVSSGSSLASTETSLPLFPKIGEVFELNLNKTVKDTAAIEALKAEPSITFGDGGKLHYNSQKVTVKLLYSEDSSEKKAFASTIAAQLSAAGIETELVGKNYSGFLSSVAAKGFDLYIGEIKLTNSLSLSSLFDSAKFGLSVSPEIRASYTSFCSGETKTADFLNTFNESLPLIPIMFKSSTVAYSKNIVSTVIPMVSDSYFSLQNLE